MDAASGTCFNESQKIAVAFSENIPYRLEASKSLLGPTADLLHQFERQIINVYIYREHRCVRAGRLVTKGKAAIDDGSYFPQFCNLPSPSETVHVLSYEYCFPEYVKVLTCAD